MNIKKLLFKSTEINGIVLRGWITANRGNTKIRFIDINDGSTITSLQLVIKSTVSNFSDIEKWRIGSSIFVSGNLLKSKSQGQEFECDVLDVQLLSLSDDDFPIQKQEISFETLRDNFHTRHRTNILRSVMLIRSTLSKEIHNFFDKEDFLYMNSPIITSNDGEGAGEAFIVDSEADKNFFLKKATLSVTGQLHAESYAIGFKKVYTFGPTFRAEKSNTKKHAAEFWMVEPEVAFFELQNIIKLADDMLKTVIKNTISKHSAEFEFLDNKSENKLLKNLWQYLDNPLKIIDYKEAIKILEKATIVFENSEIKFGIDLSTEHERYLSENHFKGPVAVINYPKDFKAFYMHLNGDKKTVAAFDLLVPGIGELIGGSQREVRIEILNSRMRELGIDVEDLKWYLDLRRFGDSGSSGFGLGFERLIMYVTGIENIRDVIPFPRTVGNLKM
ncbi:MAG: asparagine--tRNA ligase [Mycoplasmataceae bacterium]|nr:asparagine--tRNA ligase [Mycoplasmataceae bacterium]